MKVQVHNSSKPQQYAADTLTKSTQIMTFPTALEVTKILCSIRLLLDGKAGKEIPEY